MAAKNNELKTVHRKTLSLGFELVRSRKHRIYRHTVTARIVPVAGSRSDIRAMRNCVSEMARIHREAQAVISAQH
jgi:predicted RNA binding protein YcfA (HicA-like mRNA interferase family)